jgi:phospholipid/cholesterol/gamma-HCH transport system substrate-binding protein
MTTAPGDLIRSNQKIGAIVLVSLIVLILAALQAGLLRRVVNPVSTLRVVMPDAGFSGLVPGAAVEVMGTRAGEVRRIVIDPQQTLHAEVEIRDDMRPFVRRDSRAIIRKQFGVAGPSYLEITRGSGPPLDWRYAVIDAEPDRAPTDNVGQMIDDLRARVIPLIDDTARTVKSLATLAESLAAPEGELRRTLASISAISERLDRGEGVIGRVLSDEELAQDLEAAIKAARDGAGELRSIMAELEKTSRDVSAVSAAVRKEADSIPAMIQNANAALASLRTALRDLGRTTPELPGIARNLNAASANLPSLLAQTEQATAEIELLVRQLRGHWLFGGDDSDTVDQPGRLPPREIRP